jgi:UDP-N-acetylglucosamine acyltransferase
MSRSATARASARTWLSTGHTRIGRDNEIFQFCSIGGSRRTRSTTPSRRGSRSAIATPSASSALQLRHQRRTRGVTRVGNDNWIMAYVHVAHDCQVGNHTIFANNATLAGHVHVGDWAILGGFTGVHQFCRVGAHSFCGVGTVLLQDLPPFVTVPGNPAARTASTAKVSSAAATVAEAIAAIKRAYKRALPQRPALEEARQRDRRERPRASAEVRPCCPIFIAESGRGIIR